MRRAVLAAFCFLLACSVDDLDVTGKACPCPGGFTCDPATNTCAKGTASGQPSSSAASSTGSGGGAGGAAVVCSGVCGTPGCGDCPATPVVQVDDYDVDATEVTAASYAAFVATSPDPANQPGSCLWNDRFAVVDDDPTRECVRPFDPTTFPDRPVTCIDWCDASAYCAWAKRHLCGRIGGGPLLTKEEGGDPLLSEWHHACTNAGTQAYPYGDAFDPTACNTVGSGNGGHPIDVGAEVACVGGFAGLMDMSGNVEEWEGACSSGVDPDDPADDGCNLRGGAFWTDDVDSRCDGLKYAPARQLVSDDWGFRCCGPSM